MCRLISLFIPLLFNPKEGKAIPIIIFVSHYRTMAKPISQSGEKKRIQEKKTYQNVNK